MRYYNLSDKVICLCVRRFFFSPRHLDGVYLKKITALHGTLLKNQTVCELERNLQLACIFASLFCTITLTFNHTRNMDYKVLHEKI